MLCSQDEILGPCKVSSFYTWYSSTFIPAWWIYGEEITGTTWLFIIIKISSGLVKETSRDQNIVTFTESLGPQIMRQHNPPCKTSYYFSPTLASLNTNLQNSSIFIALCGFSWWNCRTSKETSFHCYVYARFKVKIIVILDVIVRASPRSLRTNIELFLQLNSRPLPSTEFPIKLFFNYPSFRHYKTILPKYVSCNTSHKTI